MMEIQINLPAQKDAITKKGTICWWDMCVYFLDYGYCVSYFQHIVHRWKMANERKNRKVWCVWITLIKKTWMDCDEKGNCGAEYHIWIYHTSLALLLLINKLQLNSQWNSLYLNRDRENIKQLKIPVEKIFQNMFWFDWKTVTSITRNWFHHFTACGFVNYPVTKILECFVTDSYIILWECRPFPLCNTRK